MKWKDKQNFPLNLIHGFLPIPIFPNLKIDDRPPPFSPILNACPRPTYRISSSDSNIHPLHVQPSSIFRFAVCKTVNGHTSVYSFDAGLTDVSYTASVAVAWITSGTNLKIRMVAPWVEFQISTLGRFPRSGNEPLDSSRRDLRARSRVALSFEEKSRCSNSGLT